MLKEYNKAVLETEEFTLNADIAEASVPSSEDLGGEIGGGSMSAGVEFEILTNGNDEI